jgi:hypothetical protein
MPLTPLTGSATTTVKVPDLNAVITALNAELATLGSRISSLEEHVNRPMPDHGHVALADRVAALENKPDLVIPPDLTTRVEALEALIVRSPVEAPAPVPMAYEPVDRPEGIDPDEPTLVYDKATIYLGDMELHALRINATKWRLFAKLNYIVLASTEWTYDEIVEGTPDEVYAHALRRLRELAELKPQHDAVHDRVRRMSEGAP